MTSAVNGSDSDEGATTLRLADGRTLGYAEYGTPDGAPVFFFPGTPGSRYFHVPAAVQTHEPDVRVIVPDRPGYGVSTLDSQLELLDWPADVAALADDLDIETFAVAGHSGGGAFALACAVELPKRVTGVGLVSAIAPFYRPEIRERMSEREQQIGQFVETDPGALRTRGEEVWAQAQDDPVAAFDGLVENSCPVDQEVLERPEIREMMVANLGEASRQGPEVWAHESELFFTEWGFEISDILLHVDLWQGEHDDHVPPFMAEYLIETLSECTGRVVADEGHTIFVSHWSEILETITTSDQH